MNISNQCVVYSSEADYKMQDLYSSLNQTYNIRFYREVLYINYLQGHVFVYPYGTVVCWMLDEQQCSNIIMMLRQYYKSSFSQFEIDINHANKTDRKSNKIYSERYSLAIGDKLSIADGTITLDQESISSMLAISHGIAQSEKLGVFEYKIDDLINEIQPLYQYLGKYGKIALTRTQISKKIGQLFSVRSFINLHMSILDTPDFFWEREELEPTYQKAIGYLELKPRMHALNARMSIIQELYDVLHNELQTRHSHVLEWIIIILILIEVVMSLLKI